MIRLRFGSRSSLQSVRRCFGVLRLRVGYCTAVGTQDHGFGVMNRGIGRKLRGLEFLHQLEGSSPKRPPPPSYLAQHHELIKLARDEAAAEMENEMNREAAAAHRPEFVEEIKVARAEAEKDQEMENEMDREAAAAHRPEFVEEIKVARAETEMHQVAAAEAEERAALARAEAIKDARAEAGILDPVAAASAEERAALARAEFAKELTEIMHQPPPPYESLSDGLVRMHFSNGSGLSFKEINKTQMERPPPAPPAKPPRPAFTIGINVTDAVPLEKTGMFEYYSRVVPSITAPPPVPPSYQVANSEKRDLRLFYAGPIYHQTSHRGGVVVQRAAELFKEEVRST
jgi:hypothetical protein